MPVVSSKLRDSQEKRNSLSVSQIQSEPVSISARISSRESSAGVHEAALAFGDVPPGWPSRPAFSVSVIVFYPQPRLALARGRFSKIDDLPSSAADCNPKGRIIAIAAR